MRSPAGILLLQRKNANLDETSNMAVLLITSLRLCESTSRIVFVRKVLLTPFDSVSLNYKANERDTTSDLSKLGTGRRIHITKYPNEVSWLARVLDDDILETKKEGLLKVGSTRSFSHTNGTPVFHYNAHFLFALWLTINNNKALMHFL